jgi:WhiB family transcriptional regulator, redox-sensing transcriptional regulator
MRHITTYEAPTTGMRKISDTSWQSRGACNGMDLEDADAVFFALPRDFADIAEAKELCGWCPVRSDCLNYALENGIQDGIWGGLTPPERRTWQKGLPQRLDYRRVTAFFQGRDVHLTQAEREVVIDHAYVRGWRPDRLAIALNIGPKHARDLLRQAANKVSDRERRHRTPRPRKKRDKTAPTTGTPAPKPHADQPLPHPVASNSAPARLGKAA